MRDSLSIRVDSSLAPVAFLACARVASSANLSDRDCHAESISTAKLQN